MIQFKSFVKQENGRLFFNWEEIMNCLQNISSLVLNLTKKRQMLYAVYPVEARSGICLIVYNNRDLVFEKH